ncbi:MAG: D-alanyl-D-alanine endopeptidase [Pseudomonadales bacterium]|nr:D-alanyl-D-alanine endopeptidase [Pseudomonadales bacterium]MDP6471625.1 D-alanyl-D-alanine endopeptidase [Pseudomonadales bacterium]MDP6970498.1 D-alanyl-D-alanine endopeptidase [Pseudomonadales bacterium]
MNSIVNTAKPILLAVACTMLSVAALAAEPKGDLALASVSAVAVDLDSGEILIAKHPDAPLSIASITKLMTAMVVLDSGEGLDEWLRIKPWDEPLAKNAFSRIRLQSKARRKDLLRVALMSSENRAAFNVAANHPGGAKAFIEAMNVKADQLGMHDSTFVDPTGLSPDNRSTAADLARMVAAAHGYELIGEYSTTRQHTVRFQGPRYKLGYGNTNPLTGSFRWDVSLQKTGYLTEAGRCLVMVTRAGDTDVAMVMLNSFGKRSPLGDAGRMRRWLESGTVSRVAGAAKDYERRMVASFGLASPPGGE